MIMIGMVKLPIILKRDCIKNNLILHFQKHFQTSEFEVPFTDGQTEIVYKN